MSEQSGSGKGDVSISIGNVERANNITVAGGDLMVNHNSQGNTVRHQSITVAGIPTTTDKQATLLQKIDELEKTVEAEYQLPATTISAAKRVIGRLRAWFKAPDALNPNALTRMFRGLTRLGQRVRGALTTVMMDALFEQALKNMGLNITTFMHSVQKVGAAVL